MLRTTRCSAESPPRFPGRVATISVTDLHLSIGTCVPEVDGRLVRSDGLHFTAPAARWLAPTLYRQLATAGLLP
jgi:hypothetical protein